MRTKSPMRFRLFLSVLILSLLAGCGAAGGGEVNAQMERGLTANSSGVENGKTTDGREAALGERFTINHDEKVSIKDTKLTLQLKTVRRSWLANGKGEFVDAEFLITLDGKEQTEWIRIGAQVTVGDYLVKLRGAYPFGKTNATLMVTRK